MCAYAYTHATHVTHTRTRTHEGTQPWLNDKEFEFWSQM